jgi:hypothetical protein
MLRSWRILHRGLLATVHGSCNHASCLCGVRKEEGGGGEKKKKLPACRGEGSAGGLQLRVRFVPAALLAMLRTALALQCVRRRSLCVRSSTCRVGGW